jgi:hypothetical protein
MELVKSMIAARREMQEISRSEEVIAEQYRSEWYKLALGAGIGNYSSAKSTLKGTDS